MKWSALGQLPWQALHARSAMGDWPWPFPFGEGAFFERIVLCLRLSIAEIETSIEGARTGSP